MKKKLILFLNFLLKIKIINKYSIIFTKKYIRSFYKLKKNNKIYIIDKIKYDLANCNLSSETHINYFYKNFLSNDIKLFINQKILNNLLGNLFSKYLLISFFDNKFFFVYPLPYKWINVLEKNNIKFNFIKKNLCVFLYYNYLILFFFKGLFLIILSFFSILNFFMFKKQNYINSIFVQNYVEEKSKIGQNNKISQFQFINYYGYEMSNLKVYSDTKKNKSFFLLKVSTLGEFFKFTYKILILIIFLLPINIFKLNFTFLFIFEDILKAITFDVKNNLNTPLKYYFHQYSFKPLWASIAENKSKGIYLYFYSINFYRLKRIGYSSYLNWRWLNANWKNILIWDQKLELVFKNLSYKPAILQSKPILIEHLVNYKKLNMQKYIILFEIQPFRILYSASVGGDLDYYDFNNCSSFISDIIKICSKYKIKIVIKRKRYIGKIIDQKYFNYINNLVKNNSDIILVHNEYLIDELINNSILSICMPFTSAAYLSMDLNKPSLFYDSSGQLNEKDNISKDILFINQFDKLENYFQTFFK